MSKKSELIKKQFIKICMAIAMFTIILCFSSTQAQAASTKDKALAAYNKLLSQKTLKWSNTNNFSVTTSKCKFALLYVDNNSVPELFVDASGAGTNHVSGFYKLYTFYNGKVRDLCTIRDSFGYYKRKGVFTTATYLHGEYVSYFALTSGKAALRLRSESYYTTQYYDRKGNKLTEAAFNKKLKSAIGTSKPTAFSCKPNTKANRTKYL